MSIVSIDHKNLEETVALFDVEQPKSLWLIKYEVLTPDSFIYMLQAAYVVGKLRDKQKTIYRYFVIYEEDYAGDFDYARKEIEKWTDSPAMLQKAKVPTTDFQCTNEFAAVLRRGYACFLAEVERPKGDGYFATFFTLDSVDDLREKFPHYSEEQITALQASLDRANELSKASNTANDKNLSFAEAFLKRRSVIIEHEKLMNKIAQDHSL
jgi:hypothetical protein